jgi:peptidoglycan/xylan/chitin deacetylase (PgdA/CDA1 family)
MVYVIITIDTENLQSLLIQQKYNTNLINKNVKQIVSSLDKYNLKGNFFVNVYESKVFGEDEIKNVCKYLNQREHDVGLHTHPVWSFDRKRVEMYEYDLEEQVKIIQHGKELIKKWIGKYPIAHRAGGYSANIDTLKSLKINDIPIDSSNFCYYPNCKLNITKNKIVEVEGVIEIPVNVFTRINQIRFGPFKTIKRKIKKVDIDWDSYSEITNFIEISKKENIRLINIFLHSYSVINSKKIPSIVDNYENIEKFEKILETIKKDDEIQVITINKFYKLFKKNMQDFIGSDIVPNLNYETKIFDYILKKIRK